jgi:molybdopterin synthase catalytic subunit
MATQRTGTDPIRLVAIRETPLSVDEVLAAVADPSAGGTAVFIGTVRDHHGSRAVAALGYSAHPSVEAAMRAVADKVVATHQVVALAVVHRVGDLDVGDLAVVVAVAGEHRGEAFLACRMLIDNLKAEVPIWKHERFEDGSQEWVGLP